MDNLDIMTAPAARQVEFGVFNLTWPNMIFWALVIAVFVLAIWARIPKTMESDSSSRKEEAAE